MINTKQLDQSTSNQTEMKRPELLKLDIFGKVLMLMKKIRTASYLVLSVALSSSILFTGWTSTFAATAGFTPPENYRQDDSIDIGIKASGNSEREEVQQNETGLEDIFGSQQVFPFEMGLGNSAF